ncbi:MAG: WhiB family transcriptional regulator [Streptosporangiaceae bacterium]
MTRRKPRRTDRREQLVKRADGEVVALPALPQAVDLPDLPGALCIGVDPEAWFAEDSAAVSAAKAICSRCPVRRECLVWALETGEPHGVWGGLTEQERAELRIDRGTRHAKGARPVGRELLDLTVTRRGAVVAELTGEADPKDPDELRRLLLAAVRRDGRDASQVAEYELQVRYAGERGLLTTFVAAEED